MQVDHYLGTVWLTLFPDGHNFSVNVVKKLFYIFTRIDNLNKGEIYLTYVMSQLHFGKG